MGVVIQAARGARGITQNALAEKMDGSLRTVIAIENGKRNPTFDVLYKIIRELRDANEQEHRIAIASARSIWRELRRDEN
jgi:transcriptional regulator with XRE-family HTH domain